MLLPASVADNVVTCHSAEHPCGASALRGLLAVDWFLDRCRTTINVLGDINVMLSLRRRTP